MPKTSLLKAIAHETRLAIIKLLLQHNYCVRALANELDLTEATISQHLKVLREAGLVRGEKRGYFMHYSVQRSVLLELAEELRTLAKLGQETCLAEKNTTCASEKDNSFRQSTCHKEPKDFYHGVNQHKREEDE